MNKDQETGTKIVFFWEEQLVDHLTGADSLCRLENEWEIIMER